MIQRLHTRENHVYFEAFVQSESGRSIFANDAYVDSGLGGSGDPDMGETATHDGWAVMSGPSAASPQIAAICALLKQVQPGLSPDLDKVILRDSARDVKTGQSFQGQPAGDGHDGATGAGLVDAEAAYQLARSVKIRNVYDLPAPR